MTAFDAPIGTPGANETELLSTIVLPVGNQFSDYLPADCTPNDPAPGRSVPDTIR